MAKRIIAISLLMAFLPVCACADIDWWRRYWKDSGLSVTGSQTYAFRSNHIQGNKTTFGDDNYEPPNETNLTVTGKLFDHYNVNATFTDNRWNPSETIFTLGYEGKRTKVDFGDISASLTGNELVPFNRRLRGVMLNQKVGSSNFTGIFSQTKAATQTVERPGNNTPGPYYLSASQIIDGSERVMIDDREIPRTDKDGISNYTLDSFSGTLQFRDSLIVPSTSRITISFETRGFNNNTGTVWGVRGNIPVSNKLNFGLTYLTQATGKQRGLQTRTDWFTGSGAPRTKYQLLYAPLGIVTVKIDAITLPPPIIRPEDGTVDTENSAFYVNYEQHYIVINQLVPPSSDIAVLYTPQQIDTVSGDKSVLGFDSTFKVSDKISVQGQFASSSAGYGGEGRGGNALNLSANGNLDKLNFSVGLKNVDPTYSSVDSTGFMRQEKGGNMRLQYKPNEIVSFNTSFDKYKRPRSFGYYSTPMNSPLDDHTNWTNNLVLTFPKWPTISLSRSYLSNYGDAVVVDGDNTTETPGTTTDPTVSQVANSQTTDAIDLRWSDKSGKITLGTGFARNTNKDDARPEWSSVSNTSRFNAQYLPGSKLSLALDLANSKVTDGTGSSYDAKNSSITANYMPTSALAFTANYRISDSGRITPFYTDSGSGFQNLVSGPSYGGKSITKLLGARYSPSTKFAIDANLNQVHTEGGYSTNTATNGTDFGLTLAPWEWLQFTGYLSLQDMKYIGSTGAMDNEIQYLTLRLGPIRQFTLNMNYQQMQSGGYDSEITDMGLNMNSFTAELRRPIGRGRSAFFQYQTSDSTGYMSEIKNVTSLGIDFPITKILGVTFDWRITDYTNHKDVIQNYKANSLNVELGARFH